MDLRNWLLAQCSRSEISILDGGGFQSRHESISKLLSVAYERAKSISSSEMDQEIAIYSDDYPDPVSHPCPWPTARVFNISDVREQAGSCFPCHCFWNWKEARIDDYEVTISHLQNHCPPEIDMLFWIGNIHTHVNRSLLLKVASENIDLMDCRPMSWDSPAAYVSLEDHANFKMLIDVEGRGYSGRTKMLAHAPSLLFIQDRQLWDWGGSLLRPDEHYIPVKNDFSDLREKIEYAKARPAESSEMVKACQNFASKNLTREAAVRHIMKIVFRCEMP